ncbi:MAG: DUF6351 family protein, partial [Actinomycetota bacterium]
VQGGGVMSRRSYLRRVPALAIAVIMTVLGTFNVSSAVPPGDVELRIVSNRADLISGGNALVDVVVPERADPGELTLDVDGRDVTSALDVRPNGHFQGLLTELAEGPNVLTARLPDGRGASLEITSHHIGGPVFSGDQVPFWRCTTADNGLGDPVDERCNAPTVYEFFYMPSDGSGFQPYDPEAPPEDVGTTTTDEGSTVPYIIRQETGTQNRGIYRVAVLYDPAQPWEPWAPQEAWNGKLFYPFGASCGTNYSQGSAQDVQDETALGRGFMVATSSLNVLGSNCNTVTSAESVMMLKEHIVETYGEIRYTFGRGGSGGSIGQLTVTNAYPGLLQGLIPSATYPDVWTTAYEVVDCHLLLRYFTAKSPHLWTDPAQQTAVNGHEGVSSCIAWEALFSHVANPGHGCWGAQPVGGPDPENYHPVLNRRGCRGTISDLQVAVWGRRQQDGFAKVVYDNVGVQYGLKALENGEISAEQFVDLNEKIGGLDFDGNFVPGRSLADPGTTLIGHRSGQVTDGYGLADVAIIDLPPTSNVEIHTPYHAFSLDERLLSANGTHENHAIWRGGDQATAFDTMDQWLTAVEADTTDDPLAVKVIRNRPETAVDSCWIDGVQETDEEICDAAFPYYGDARIAAGSPLSSDKLKCQLMPLDRDSYAVELTDDQWDRLKAVFTEGVCDWSAPGVDQVPSQPWTTFQDGPGGRPLGDPPRSIPLPKH